MVTHTSMIVPLLELTSVHVPDPVGALHHKLGTVQLPRPSLPPPALKQAAVVEAGVLGTLGLNCLLRQQVVWRGEIMEKSGTIS